MICLIFFALALLSSAGFDWSAAGMKYSGNGIIADEIPHISGGYYYLKTHRYFINPEHPPLVKDIAGLGELFARPNFPKITDQTDLGADFHREEYPIQKAEFPKALERANNQDYFGVLFLFGPGNNPDRIAFFARLAVILANTLLLYLLFRLLAKIWSARAALLGLFFFAISQFSIAHGSFVVIDFMSAVLTGIALVSIAIYLKRSVEGRRTVRWFFLTSFFFFLALVSKFSSVVLLPAAFAGGLFFVALADIRNWVARHRTSLVLKYIFSYAAIVVLALFFVSIFYAFHVSKMENDVLVQKINENYPEEQLPAVGHKILEYMVYLSSLTKGLAEYANGTFMVVSRMVVSSQSTYFLGHVFHSEGAGIWYFPVLYATKLSLGLHFFTLLVLILVIARSVVMKQSRSKQKNTGLLLPLRRDRNDNEWRSNPLPLLLLVFIVSYMAVTLRSTFQIGLRHIMPVILAVCLLTGKGVDNFWDGKIWQKAKLRHLFAIVAVLMTISVFWAYPYYLEYYNILGGGTGSGYKIATDSNYDWGGSDVRRLAKWMRDNNVREIYTHMFADVPLKYYLGPGQQKFNLQDDGKLPPRGSYLAVSVFEYMANVFGGDAFGDRNYSRLDPYLAARVGKTIFVYKIP